MNSQIYCLPKKFGWNAMQCTSDARAEKRAENLEKIRSLGVKKPYFTVQFHQQPPSQEATRLFQTQYPKLAERSTATGQDALSAVYTSEYAFKYGPDFTPMSSKPTPPVVYECLADPLLKRRQLHPPFSSVKPPSYNVFDPHRGAHEWRELIPKPGMYIWQPLQKIPTLGNPGLRSTMLPVRVKQHDPSYEKNRWDTIRNLVRKNAVSYAYRCDMSGFAGFKPTVADLGACVEKDVARPNLGMVSTTHAVHRPIPLLDCGEVCNRDVSRPIGAAFRLVTIGHADQPLPPPSACN